MPSAPPSGMSGDRSDKELGGATPQDFNSREKAQRKTSRKADFLLRPVRHSSGCEGRRRKSEATELT